MQAICHCVSNCFPSLIRRSTNGRCRTRDCRGCRTRSCRGRHTIDEANDHNNNYDDSYPCSSSHASCPLGKSGTVGCCSAMILLSCLNISIMLTPWVRTLLHSNPAKITCPYCKHQGVTRTSEMIDTMTIVAVIVLLLLFWPLFWLPLCMPGCKATEHYCANCNRVVGKAEACT